MKKMIFFIIIIFLGQQLSIAQEGKPEMLMSNFMDKAALETKAMVQGLALDSTQKDSVARITADYYYRVAILQGQSLKAIERDIQLRKLGDDWKAGLKRHLTGLQYNLYFEEKDLRRQKLDSIRNSQGKRKLSTGNKDL